MGISVMLVDDHNMVSEVLCALLAREADMEVVAICDNGRDAVRKAREEKPDIIVMDVAMPEMNGLEACRQIMADNAASRIIILSMFAERKYVVEALRAGARGYIHKKSAFKMLVGAIRSVARDGGYLDPKITGIVVDDYVQHIGEAENPDDNPLTSREREVLQLIAEGKSTKEIAYTLDVGTKTVETHRLQIMKKLRLTNVADLTRYAIREGLSHL
ncbi:MAG TPA: response regulator transcription factor [Geobacteraceae bacterium]